MVIQRLNHSIRQEPRKKLIKCLMRLHMIIVTIIIIFIEVLSPKDRLVKANPLGWS